MTANTQAAFRQSFWVLILSVMMGTVPCSGQLLKVSNPLAQNGISVYQYGSPEFDDAVNKIIDPEGRARLNAFLPYCLVVKNGTGRFLAGITILYKLPDFKDKAGVPLRVNGEPFKITTSARTTIRDRNGMFSPGDLRLVSPTTPINGTISDAGIVKLRPLVDDNIMQIVDFNLEQLREGAVYASVDSITTEDALLYGPDDSKLLAKWNQHLLAQADLRNEVLALRGEDLRRSLTRTAGLTWRTEYLGKKAQVAEAWLQSLENKGETAFLDHLTSINQFEEIKRGDK